MNKEFVIINFDLTKMDQQTINQINTLGFAAFKDQSINLQEGIANISCSIQSQNLFYLVIDKVGYYFIVIIIIIIIIAVVAIISYICLIIETNYHILVN